MTSFTILECEKARDFIAQHNPIIVDIRDAAAYQQGHIPGAQHVPPAKLADFAAQQEKNQAVLVCCYHGISSQQAARFLVDQDFTDVYSLAGGFCAWAEVRALN